MELNKLDSIIASAVSNALAEPLAVFAGKLQRLEDNIAAVAATYRQPVATIPGDQAALLVKFPDAKPALPADTIVAMARQAGARPTDVEGLRRTLK